MKLHQVSVWNTSLLVGGHSTMEPTCRTCKKLLHPSHQVGVPSEGPERLPHLYSKQVLWNAHSPWGPGGGTPGGTAPG